MENYTNLQKYYKSLQKFTKIYKNQLKSGIRAFENIINVFLDTPGAYDDLCGRSGGVGDT